MLEDEKQDLDIPLLKRAGSRRFIIAMVFAVGGTIGLYQDKINSADFYLLAGAVLAGYAGTEWVKKKK